MMRPTHPTPIRLAAVLVAGLLALPAHAQQPRKAGAEPADRLWFVWERLAQDRCAGTTCPSTSSYVTRLIPTPDEPSFDRALGMLHRLATIRRATAEAPPPPRFCNPGQAGAIERETLHHLEKPERAQLLLTLAGVHLDATKLKAPADYAGDFGADIQAAAEARFQQAGFRLFTKEEVEAVIGRPAMSIYFTPTSAGGHCDFSVFISVSQDAVLIADPSLRVTSGVWSVSERRSGDHPNDTEYEAILRGVDRFLADWTEARTATGATASR